MNHQHLEEEAAVQAEDLSSKILPTENSMEDELVDSPEHVTRTVEISSRNSTAPIDTEITVKEEIARNTELQVDANEKSHEIKALNGTKTAKNSLIPTALGINVYDPLKILKSSREAFDQIKAQSNTTSDSASLKNEALGKERFIARDLPEVLVDTRLRWILAMLCDYPIQKLLQSLLIEKIRDILNGVQSNRFTGREVMFTCPPLPFEDVLIRQTLQLCQLPLLQSLDSIVNVDDVLLRVAIPDLVVNAIDLKMESENVIPIDSELVEECSRYKSTVQSMYDRYDKSRFDDFIKSLGRDIRNAL